MGRTVSHAFPLWGYIMQGDRITHDSTRTPEKVNNKQARGRDSRAQYPSVKDAQSSVNSSRNSSPSNNMRRSISPGNTRCPNQGHLANIVVNGRMHRRDNIQTDKQTQCHLTRT